MAAIQGLLLPLEEKGILAPRSDAQLLSDLRFFRVAERDANVRPAATGCRCIQQQLIIRRLEAL